MATFVSPRTDQVFRGWRGAFRFSPGAAVSVGAPAPPTGDVVLHRLESFDGEHAGVDELAQPSLDRANAHMEAFGQMFL
jgi:hypothetical protein